MTTEPVTQPPTGGAAPSLTAGEAQPLTAGAAPPLPAGAAQPLPAGGATYPTTAGPYGAEAGPYPMTSAGQYPTTGAGPYGPETRWHPMPPATDYRMRRSRTDKMIAGVCGGIAEHTDIDPVYIRLAFLVSLFWGGIGFFAYAAAALLMPKPLSTGS